MKKINGQKTKEQKIHPSGLPNAIIPLKVATNENLKIREKMLFGLLYSLSNDEGWCIACNEWLGKLMNVKPQTITNALGNLKQQKCILIKYEKTPESGITRKIYINPEYLD